MNLHVPWSMTVRRICIFRSWGRYSKDLILLVIVWRYRTLRCEYIGHVNIKWSSFSTAWGQNGQNRWSLWVSLWRPTSIINRWLDNLNLVTRILSVTFLISVRYFSNPTSFLKSAQVLNLLELLLIFSNAFWWKLSLNLSNNFV